MSLSQTKALSVEFDDTFRAVFASSLNGCGDGYATHKRCCLVVNNKHQTDHKELLPKKCRCDYSPTQ